MNTDNKTTMTTINCCTTDSLTVPKQNIINTFTTSPFSSIKFNDAVLPIDIYKSITFPNSSLMVHSSNFNESITFPNFSLMVHSSNFNDLIIEELVPYKVYKFTYQGKTTKTIRLSGDPFNLNYACHLALMKIKFKKVYTFEGILEKTKESMLLIENCKIVDKAIKKFFKEKEKLAEEKEEKEIAERHRKKLIEKKIARRKRKEEEKAKLYANTIANTLIDIASVEFKGDK